jgi:hypothetical protein
MRAVGAAGSYRDKLWVHFTKSKPSRRTRVQFLRMGSHQGGLVLSQGGVREFAIAEAAAKDVAGLRALARQVPPHVSAALVDRLADVVKLIALDVPHDGGPDKSFHEFVPVEPVLLVELVPLLRNSREALLHPLVVNVDGREDDLQQPHRAELGAELGVAGEGEEAVEGE